MTGMYQSQGLSIQQNNLTYRNCYIYMINHHIFCHSENSIAINNHRAIAEFDF